MLEPSQLDLLLLVSLGDAAQPDLEALPLSQLVLGDIIVGRWGGIFPLSAVFEQVFGEVDFTGN